MQPSSSKYEKLSEQEYLLFKGTRYTQSLHWQHCQSIQKQPDVVTTDTAQVGFLNAVLFNQKIPICGRALFGLVQSLKKENSSSSVVKSTSLTMNLVVWNLETNSQCSSNHYTFWKSCRYLCQKLSQKSAYNSSKKLLFTLVQITCRDFHFIRQQYQYLY